MPTMIHFSNDRPLPVEQKLQEVGPQLAKGGGQFTRADSSEAVYVLPANVTYVEEYEPNDGFVATIGS
jgi:hypothetical protein